MANSKLVLKLIKSLNEYQAIQKAQQKIYNQNYLDSQKPNLCQANWDFAKAIVSQIIGEDFEAFHKRLDKTHGGKKPGWTAVGFVPDELLGVLLYSEGKTPQQVYNQVLKLISLV